MLADKFGAQDVRHLARVVPALEIARQLAAIERSAIGRHRHDHVVRSQPVVLGELDGADDIGKARQPEILERAQQRRLDSQPFRHVGTADVGVEYRVEPVRRLVRNADHHVGVHDVVNERHMLVADALDVVLAVAVHEQRRALDGFHHRNPRAVPRLEIIAGRQRSRGTRRRHVAGQPQAFVRPAKALVNTLQRRSRYPPVAEVVAEFAELVDDLVLGIAREFGAGVVNLLDVRFRTRRAHDVARRLHPALQPLEPLAAHTGRQHGDTTATDDRRNGDTTTAIVARRRPDRALPGGIEPARDQARGQTRVGGEHLVRVDHREQRAEGNDDARIDTGQGFRQRDMQGNRHPARARGVIVPVDAKEVRRMRFVRADACELC